MTVLYDGSTLMEQGQIPFKYQSYIRPHVTVVPDPLGGNFKCMKYAIADSDRPYSGASNPRADFETPGHFTNGSDLFFSFKVLLPKDFPVIKGGSGFFQIMEVYGPPHGGSPPLGIDLVPGPSGRPCPVFERGAMFHYDKPWAGPPLDTNWHTFIVHTRSAPDNTGFVELWFDGKPQTMSNGKTRINYPTLAPGVNWDGHTANVLNINSYRRAGAYPGVVTLYQAAAKVATTLAEVQSGVTPPPPPPVDVLAALFTAPATSKIGQTVSFDASTSTGSPISYSWVDAGAHNAPLGTGAKMSFTFHYKGTKQVKLTITDAQGATATVTHNVVVS